MGLMDHYHVASDTTVAEKPAISVTSDGALMSLPAAQPSHYCTIF